MPNKSRIGHGGPLTDQKRSLSVSQKLLNSQNCGPNDGQDCGGKVVDFEISSTLTTAVQKNIAYFVLCALLSPLVIPFAPRLCTCVSTYRTWCQTESIYHILDILAKVTRARQCDSLDVTGTLETSEVHSGTRLLGFPAPRTSLATWYRMSYPFHFHVRVSTPLAALDLDVSETTADMKDALADRRRSMLGQRLGASEEKDEGARNACCTVLPALAVDAKHMSGTSNIIENAIAPAGVAPWTRVCSRD